MQHFYDVFFQILEGSFSAVSKPIFAIYAAFFEFYKIGALLRESKLGASTVRWASFRRLRRAELAADPLV